MGCPKVHHQQEWNNFRALQVCSAFLKTITYICYSGMHPLFVAVHSINIGLQLGIYYTFYPHNFLARYKANLLVIPIHICLV